MKALRLLRLAALLSGFFCMPLVAFATSAGLFHVSNGQIIAPNGNAFIARGINIYASNLAGAVDPSGNPLVSTFPGLNMIRLNVFTSDLRGSGSLSALRPAVDTLTAKGVVVEIEIHDYPRVLSGSALSTVTKWFGTLASAFNGNPYVWFGTQNEPDEHDPQGVMNEIQQIYQAVRNAGNNTIVMMDAGGAYTTKGLNASAFSSMTNVVWDTHYYNWISHYATGLAANQKALAKQIGKMQAIRSADETIPVIIGEFGDSTDGDRIDPGWRQAVQAVLGSGYGYLAWQWNPGGKADRLLNPPYRGGQNELTPYGSMIANDIAAKAAR